VGMFEGMFEGRSEARPAALRQSWILESWPVSNPCGEDELLFDDGFELSPFELPHPVRVSARAIVALAARVVLCIVTPSWVVVLVSGR
jgi:hypothetical protein